MKPSITNIQPAQVVSLTIFDREMRSTTKHSFENKIYLRYPFTEQDEPFYEKDDLPTWIDITEYPIQDTIDNDLRVFLENCYQEHLENK